MLKKILGFAGKKAFEILKPKTNVPVTKLDKLKSEGKILDQKLKATGAKLKQTQFEIQNPKFKGKDFTFKKDQGKSESKKESYDRIVKENTKVLKGGSNLGMQSVKYGLDNKPEVTKLDRIAKFIAKDKKKKNKTPMDKAVKKDKKNKRFV